jgi:hypothetical protein
MSGFNPLVNGSGALAWGNYKVLCPDEIIERDRTPKKNPRQGCWERVLWAPPVLPGACVGRSRREVSVRLGARSSQDAPDCRDAEAGGLSDGFCAGTLLRRYEHPVLRAGRGGAAPAGRGRCAG